MALPAIQRIVAGQSHEGIVAPTAGQDVVSRRADEGFGEWARNGEGELVGHTEIPAVCGGHGDQRVAGIAGAWGPTERP